MLSNIKSDIKNLYYNLKRNQFLNKLNNLYSRILVESDRVIFYIDNYIFDKQFSNNEEYNLELYKIPKNDTTIEIDYEALFYHYKLNKPFYYIFDGITFDKELILNVSKPATIIFKNCTFKDFIKINKCDKVIFENNKYYCRTIYSPIIERTYLTVKETNDIKFINENFINKNISNHQTPQFGINLTANTVEINNSNIDIDDSIIVDGKIYVSDKKSEISITAQKIRLINSNFNCPNIYLESTSIINNASNLTATSGIVIENKDEDISLDNIKTPYLLYNKEEIIKKTKVKPYTLLKKLPLKK